MVINADFADGKWWLMIWLVFFRPTLLKNDGVSSSVGMIKIPNMMGKSWNSMVPVRANLFHDAFHDAFHECLMDPFMNFPWNFHGCWSFQCLQFKHQGWNRGGIGSIEGSLAPPILGENSENSRRDDRSMTDLVGEVYEYMIWLVNGG